MALISELVSQRLPHLTPLQTKCALQLNSWLSDGFALSHHVFVSCFSEAGNVLSQWRSYCGAGKGVSLGFDPDELEESCDTQGFTLRKVNYNREEQESFVGHLLDYILTRAEDEGDAPPSERHPSQSFYSLFEAWEDRIIDVTATLKHPAFVEEQEWRAISTPVRDQTDRRLKYREGAITLTPFIQFALPSSRDRKICFRHVFVGPSYDTNLAMNAIASFFTSMNSQPTEGISASAIPLRP